MRVEHPLVGVEPLGDPLRVVEPVDAEDDARVAEVEPLAYPLHRHFGRRLGRGEGDLRDVGADRIVANERALAAAPHRDPLAIDQRLQLLRYGVEEIDPVESDVESEKVAREKALEDLALPGQDPKYFRIGPRNVPEEDDREVGPARADLGGREREVIVL